MDFFLSDADAQLLKGILQAAGSVPSADLPQLIGGLAQANAVAFSRLSPTPSAASEPDQLLNIEQAAARLNLSPAYLYRHSGQLPFTIRQGRKLLFSTAGITKYIQSKTKGR